MGSARFEHMGSQVILQWQPIRGFHLDRVSPALGTLLGQPLVRNGDSRLGLALEAIHSLILQLGSHPRKAPLKHI